jgi:peptidoglycan hydrolase-like protein with peptidoglycan-binding domain
MGSIVTDTTLIGSLVNNATTTNSTIANSTVQNADLSNAIIINDTITSGTITANGTTTVITATTSLSDLINYIPVASFVTAINGLTATFTDTSSDRNLGSAIHDTWSYLWDFGDGTTATANNVSTLGNNQTHTYSVAGLYNVLLTLIDSASNSAHASAPVTVTAPTTGGGGGVSYGGGGGASYGGSGYFVGTSTATSSITSSGTTASVPTVTTALPVHYTFTRALSVGSTGDDVVALQKILTFYGYYTFPTATGYFGPITEAAVVKFQQAYNLDPFPGTVGPRTRTVLNNLQGITLLNAANPSAVATTPTLPVTPKKMNLPKATVTITPAAAKEKDSSATDIWSAVVKHFKGTYINFFFGTVEKVQ